MSYYAPCGGGYGDPLKRPASKVFEDVLDDFCTLERAFEVYGVVIDSALKLDFAATERRRSELHRQTAATTLATALEPVA